MHGKGTVSEALKYRHRSVQDIPSGFIAFSHIRRPVVFWNTTWKCNLRCVHCYLSASPLPEWEDELSFEEVEAFIDDLADMRVPLLMLTGGEPLMRKDFWDIASYAHDRGLRTALSTNGTLIDEEVAQHLKECHIEYVGISLDGANERTHDDFRKQPGSFRRAMEGLKNCISAGLKTGIRITVTRQNYREIGALLDIAVSLGVPRFCVYWLVPSGRGKDIYEQQLSCEEALNILDFLYRKAIELGDKIEILTVDAPQDAVFLMQKMKENGLKDEYESALKLIEFTGDTCSAGERVANVDPAGNVYPCQFAQIPSLKIGNIRERRFSEIWNDDSNKVLNAFRNKQKNLKGACGACEFKNICGGCRVRALSAFGDIWAEDPLCPFASHCDRDSA